MNCPLALFWQHFYSLTCMIFLPAGLWVWLTLLPTLIVNSKREDKELCTRDYIGWGVWLAGMLVESIADYQKYAFRSNPANKYVPTYSLIIIVIKLKLVAL